MYGNFDPDIVISPAHGKSFLNTEEHQTILSGINGIKGVSEVIEDNVLLRYKQSQRVVRLKGVSNAFNEYSGIKNSLVAGEFPLIKDSIGYALIGRGIQYDLSVSLQSDFYTLQIYYPRDIGPGVINPDRMYRVLSIIPGGVFAIEKYYDENYVFVPIQFARQLLNYQDKLTAYEIYLSSNSNPTQIKNQLERGFGNNYKVQLGEELHSDLFKILKIEKLFVFLILTSIIGIASINIFFSLTMLVIEKQKDIAVLISQGASKLLIRKIFLFEGCIVAFSGAGSGLFLGLMLSLLQEKFGVISMGMQSAVIDSYPVKIELGDVILSVFAIVVITILASIQPALKATGSFTTKTLQ